MVYKTLVDGIERDATEEEIARIEANKISSLIDESNLALAQQAQANAKASAHAKLSALGLSAEEISAIGA